MSKRMITTEDAKKLLASLEMNQWECGCINLSTVDTEITNKALHCIEAIKKYPKNGEAYYLILTQNYMKGILKEDGLMEELHVERTKLYELKKEAINLFIKLMD